MRVLTLSLMAIIMISAAGHVSALETSLEGTPLLGSGKNGLGNLTLKNDANTSVEVRGFIVVSDATVESGFNSTGDVPFFFDFPGTPFNISAGTSLSVFPNVTVPFYYPSGEWLGAAVVELGSGDLVVQPMILSVSQEAFENYSYNISETNITTGTGNRGVIGLNVTNLGNSPLVLRFGNMTFVEPPNDVVLNPFRKLVLLLDYTIPKNFTGIRETNLTFLNEVIPLVFDVSDDDAPNITLNYTQVLDVDEIQRISAEVTDNLPNSNLIMVLEKPSGEVVTTNSSLDIEILEYGRWRMNLTAVDASNNKRRLETAFDAVGVGFPQLESFYDLGRAHTERNSERIIFTGDKAFDFNLSMRNLKVLFHGVNLSPSDVRILANGDLLEDNNTLHFQDQKELRLFIVTLNNMTGTVSFDLLFDIPSRYLFLKNKTTASIDIVDYQLLEDFNGTWFDNPYKCRSFDAGSLSESSFECTFTFPATLRIGDVNLPTNPDWLDKFEAELRQNTRQAEGERDYNTFLLAMGGYLMVVFFLAGTFILFVYPSMRIRPRW